MAKKIGRIQDRTEISYQTLRERLDEVVLKLQDPACDVDEAVNLYEQALVIVDQLESYLVSAENRISKIQADFAVGTED